MQAIIVISLVLHVLSGVFWAGSTFTLARTGAAGGQTLFRPQMGAATIALITGVALWFLLHRGSPGTTEYLLALGALSAIIAAGVQGVWGGAETRMLVSADEGAASRSQARLATAQRVAGALLAITVVCMAAARYA